MWFPVFDLWLLPLRLGLGWVLGSPQSLRSDLALAPTKGHPTCLNSSHFLFTLLLPRKRKKEGIRAVGREGGRREKNKKEARASVRRS